MTTLYVPLGLDGHELCAPTDEDDFETLNVQIDGTPRAGGWTPLEVRVVDRDQGKALAPSDSPWLGSHALVFRPAAVDALKDLLTPCGELLPLAGEDGSLVVFNPTRVLADALDEDASSILRFSNGDIMQISEHVFRPDVVAGVDLFKIPNLRVSPTFVSQRFADRWKEAGLAGLTFEQVWTS